MPPKNNFSPEGIRPITRNTNVDFQSIGIYSRSDLQHHTRTQQFQEPLIEWEVHIIVFFDCLLF